MEVGRGVCPALRLPRALAAGSLIAVLALAGVALGAYPASADEAGAISGVLTGAEPDATAISGAAVTAYPEGRTFAASRTKAPLLETLMHLDHMRRSNADRRRTARARAEQSIARFGGERVLPLVFGFEAPAAGTLRHPIHRFVSPHPDLRQDRNHVSPPTRRRGSASLTGTPVAPATTTLASPPVKR